MISAGFLLLAAGCSKETPQAPAAAQSGAGHEGAVLRYASTKDIRNINPHLYLGEMAAQAMVFESLTRNTPDGVKPWLASSWDISADGRTYTFHLREGVRFSDGTPFDATAVDMNVRAVLDNRSRHAWLDLVNEVESTRVVDARTWELKLKHPYFPTLIELGVTRPLRFISPACMKEGKTKDGVTCLAGTGPWKLVQHERNQFARFERNPDYWGEKPSLAAVEWRVMPDLQTSLLALQKGEIDLIFGADGDQITSDAFTGLQKSGTLKVKLSEPTGSRAVLINSGSPVTSDVRVREAIQFAVDREAIVKNVLNGTEAPAGTLMARNVPGCDIELTVRGFDPQKARRLLDEAGWLTGKNGVREKDGRPLELSFYFNSQNGQEKNIAQAIQGDLARVGITLKVIGEEKQAFLDRQRTGKFDLQYSLSWGAPYDPQSYFASWRFPAHGDYQAQRGLSDKEQIDASITALMTQADEGKQLEMIHRLLRRIHESAVYLPLSYSRTKAVYSPMVENVEFAVSQYEIPFEKMRRRPAH